MKNHVSYIKFSTDKIKALTVELIQILPPAGIVRAMLARSDLSSRRLSSAVLAVAAAIKLVCLPKLNGSDMTEVREGDLATIEMG